MKWTKHHIIHIQDRRNPILRLFSPKPARNLRQLTEIINPQEDIRKFEQEGFNSIQPRQLYNKKWTFNSTQFVRDIRDFPISIKDGQSLILHVYTANPFNKAKQMYSYYHHGIIIVGIRTLHKAGTGSRALVTLMDDRFDETPEKVLALSEVDLNTGIRLIYCSPNICTLIDEGIENMKIGIKVKGCTGWQEGAHNLQVTIFVLGRGSNNAQFQCLIQSKKVIETLNSKGIRMIVPDKVSSEKYAGDQWELKDFNRKTEDNEILQPENALFYNDGRNQSVRFTNYHTASGSENPHEIEEIIVDRNPNSEEVRQKRIQNLG